MIGRGRVGCALQTVLSENRRPILIYPRSQENHAVFWRSRTPAPPSCNTAPDLIQCMGLFYSRHERTPTWWLYPANTKDLERSMCRSVRIKPLPSLEMAFGTTSDFNTATVLFCDRSRYASVATIFVALRAATDTFLYVGVVRIHWCSTALAAREHHRSGGPSPGRFHTSRWCGCSLFDVGKKLPNSTNSQHSADVL